LAKASGKTGANKTGEKPPPKKKAKAAEAAKAPEAAADEIVM